MTTARSFPPLLRLGFAPVSGVIAALLFASGCVAPLAVTTNPPGAIATMDGKPIGPTPTQYTPPGRTPISVGFSLEGYFPESFVFQPDPAAKSITAKLEPKTQTRSFDLTSLPDGAAVVIDGRPAGTTPLTGTSVVFQRDSKTAPWKEQTVTFSKPNYQSETRTLSAEGNGVPRVDLALLREARVYNITATTSEGAELNADITLNGAVIGKTPLKVPVTFQRANNTAAWPIFNFSVEIPAKYKPASSRVDFTRTSPDIGFKLDPITEITSTFIYPTTVMTPTGITYKFDQRAAVALLNTREPNDAIRDLKPVTNYGRQDVRDAASRAENVNSFCLSPDGQAIIFSLTERDDQAGATGYLSNLSIKKADDVGGGVARLTQGRYSDTLPYVANDGSNYLVFASNRTDRNKPDIFRVNLVENRLSGGISRLTNDSRFNYGPSYGDSNRQLFYLSTEPNFPTAETQISSIRLDGSLPTQMSISAIELNNVFAEKVYYVRTDADTKKKQIYSVTADGKLETALLSQEDYRTANAFNPAVSPDGSHILFVSDHGVDEQNRHNNDIYMVKSDGTDLQRLTSNGSDDIMPAWSFSEDGVIFFLSNRGGAYNVWRFKVSTAK